MVDDRKVEAEDLEVPKIFNDAKTKHCKIMTGMYTMYNVMHVIHVGDIRNIVYECNALNSTHVREVRDTAMYL